MNSTLGSVVPLAMFSITVGDMSLAEGGTVQGWRQKLALTRRDWILSHSLRVCHSLSAAENTISGLLFIIQF